MVISAMVISAGPKNKRLQNSVSFLLHTFCFSFRWFYLTVQWKNEFLCFFCAGTECLRRWHKFLSIFFRYYQNLDILPQLGRYEQKFIWWNRQKLFFLNPIFKINYKIGQNLIGFKEKLIFVHFNIWTSADIDHVVEKCLSFHNI